MCSIVLFSQHKETRKAIEKGYQLFRLEKGSWYGTDHFLENYPNMRDKIGGYVTYETEDNHIQTVFFDKEDPTKTIVRYRFSEVPTKNPESIDIENLEATELEMSLFSIREDARRRMVENPDGFFRIYENTGINLIPVQEGKKTEVYVLTAATSGNNLLLGNDYLFEYDRKGKFKKQSKLHNSLIKIAYHSDDPEDPIRETMHTHVLSDLITATDVCTLLLYADFVEWDRHLVIGPKYVTSFNIRDLSFWVIPTKTLRKIAESD